MNRGGVLNALFGGYTFVWTYDIYTGNPVTLGFTNSPYNYLPGFIGIGGRPNLLGFATLRDNWQDLGRRPLQPGESELDDQQPGRLRLPGGVHVRQCREEHVLRRSAESAPVSRCARRFPLKERMRLQIRFDFQNPFKWYNWGNMNTTVDLKNVVAGTTTPTSANLFGKIPSGNEATSVADGGVPMMNATIKFVW